MRFLACWSFKDKDDKVIKECKILTTKTNNIYQGQYQLQAKLATDYNIPEDIIEDRDYEDPNQIGIFYVRPKPLNEVKNLRNNEIDEAFERWEELEKTYAARQDSIK